MVANTSRSGTRLPRVVVERADRIEVPAAQSRISPCPRSVVENGEDILPCTLDIVDQVAVHPVRCTGRRRRARSKSICGRIDSGLLLAGAESRAHSCVSEAFLILRQIGGGQPVSGATTSSAMSACSLCAGIVDHLAELVEGGKQDVGHLGVGRHLLERSMSSTVSALWASSLTLSGRRSRCRP